MRGFASAQRQYENMEPYANECDCEELFECGNCEHTALEGGECPKCIGAADEPIMMEPVERTERHEGQHTDPRCTTHNHWCTDRYCCD